MINKIKTKKSIKETYWPRTFVKKNKNWRICWFMD